MKGPRKHAREKTPPRKLPNFALADQFGRELGTTTYEGAPLIVVVGNREGATGVALWTAALRSVLGQDSNTHVLPVAELGNVPRILRRMVSRLLPREQSQWCALDWDGQLGAPIRGTAGPLAAAAYGADHMLRVWTRLPGDAVESALLVKLVEGAA